MEQFADIISRWPEPSISNFAGDVKLNYSTAQVMKHRNSIGSKYWADVVAAAARRGFDDVTLELLAEIAARSRNLEEAA